MLFVSDAEKLVHAFMTSIVSSLHCLPTRKFSLSLSLSLSVKLLWNNMYCDKCYKLNLKVNFEWTSSLKVEICQCCTTSLININCNNDCFQKVFLKTPFYWLKNKKPRPKLTPLAKLLLCHTDRILKINKQKCFETTTEQQCCHFRGNQPTNGLLTAVYVY